MTDPVKKRSRLPEVLAALALLAALAWMAKVMSRGHGDGPAVAMTVVPTGGVAHALHDGDRLDLADQLDFEVTVSQPSFVYVFTTEGERLSLAWQPTAAEKAWEPGTYAPNWGDNVTQLFHFVGPARLVVVAAGRLHPEASTWSSADLLNLPRVCPDCRASVTNVTTFGTPKKDTVPPPAQQGAYPQQ